MHLRPFTFAVLILLCSQCQSSAQNAVSERQMQSEYMADMQAGHLEKALELSDKALANDPNSEALLSDRGVILYRMHRYDEALKCLDKSIAVNPTSINLTSRGGVHIELKQYPDAIEDCNNALAIDSKNAVAYNNRGTAELRLGQTDKALEDLNKALSLKPDLTLALVSRGKLESDRGQLLRAKEDLDKAISFGSTDAGEFSTRAMIYWRLKNKDKAVADATKAYQLSPTPIFKKMLELMKTHPITTTLKTTDIGSERSIDVRDK